MSNHTSTAATAFHTTSTPHSSSLSTSSTLFSSNNSSSSSSSISSIATTLVANLTAAVAVASTRTTPAPTTTAAANFFHVLASEPASCVEEYWWFNAVDRWLMGFVVIPVILAGLCTNFIAILTFGSKAMRAQLINTYLLVLSVSDTAMLALALVTLVPQRTAEIVGWWWLSGFSMLASPITNPLQVAAYDTSTWTTVGMYVHRFIGVWFPLQSSIVLRPEIVYGYLGAIIGLIFLYLSPKFFETHAPFCLITPMNVTLPWLTRYGLGLNKSYLAIRSWVNMIVMFAIPFIVLVIVNAFIITAIRQSQKRRRRMTTQSERTTATKEIRVSTMLVLVVLIFLLCNTGVFVYNVMNVLKLSWEYQDWVQPFTNFFVLLNPLLNTIVYWNFVPKYRAFCARYLPKRFARAEETRTITEHSTMPTTVNMTSTAWSSAESAKNDRRAYALSTNSTIATTADAANTQNGNGSAAVVANKQSGESDDSHNRHSDENGAAMKQQQQENGVANAAAGEGHEASEVVKNGAVVGAETTPADDEDDATTAEDEKKKKRSETTTTPTVALLPAAPAAGADDDDETAEHETNL